MLRVCALAVLQGLLKNTWIYMKMISKVANELIDFLIDWIKQHSVAVCGVNLISSDDLLRKLRKLRK